MLMLCSQVMAQKAPYKVVFDVTSKDTVVHQMVIRWIKEIEAANPEAAIEVVFYAKSLGMITKDKSAVAADVIKYAKNKNVTFKVCEVAMKNSIGSESQVFVRDAIKA